MCNVIVNEQEMSFPIQRKKEGTVWIRKKQWEL